MKNIMKQLKTKLSKAGTKSINFIVTRKNALIAELSLLSIVRIGYCDISSIPIFSNITNLILDICMWVGVIFVVVFIVNLSEVILGDHQEKIKKTIAYAIIAAVFLCVRKILEIVTAGQNISI